jgi:hypothetical protein
MRADIVLYGPLRSAVSSSMETQINECVSDAGSRRPLTTIAIDLSALLCTSFRPADRDAEHGIHPCYRYIMTCWYPLYGLSLSKNEQQNLCISSKPQLCILHVGRRAVYAPRVVVGVIAPRFATHMVHRCDEGYLVIGSHDVARVD